MKRAFPLVAATLAGACIVVAALLFVLPADHPQPPGGKTAEATPEASADSSATAREAAPARDRAQRSVEERAPDAAVDAAEVSSSQVLYRVSGHVVDDATGVPASGALIQAHAQKPPLSVFDIKEEISRDLVSVPPSAEHRYRYRLNETPQDGERQKPRRDAALSTAQAADDGSFVIEGIPVPRFYLSAWRPHFVIVETPHVHIREGTEKGGVVLRLRQGAALRGRVSKPDGSPAAEARVTLGQAFDPLQALGGRMALRVPQTVTADAEGIYLFPAVPAPAAYLVTASLAPFGYPNAIRVTAMPGVTTTQDLALEAGSGLALLVRDERGQPIEAALVKLQPSQVNFEELTLHENELDGLSRRTASDGHASFEGLKAGTYRLSAAHPDCLPYTDSKIRLVAGETLSQTLALGPGLELTGTVLDLDGKPVPEAQVRAYPAPSLADIFSFSESRDTPWQSVTEDGHFALRGLPDNDLTVEAHAPDHAGAQATARPGASPVALQLVPLASIEGIVVSRVTGSIVKEFEVAIERDRGFSFDFAAMGEEAIFNQPLPFKTEDGRFRLKGLPEGSYQLEVRAAAHAARKSEWIKVKPGEPRRGVLFYLGPEGAIEGVVVDETTGEPVSGAEVALKTHAGAQIAELVASMFRDAGPTTGEDGAFRIGELSTGTYHVAARHPDYADTSLSNIAVTEGSIVRDLVLRLGRGGEIYGTVFDEAGLPLPNTKIFCNNATSTKLTSTATDDNGDYRLSGLPEGRYVVTLFPRGLTLSSEEFLSQFTEGLDTQTVALAEGERVRLDFRKGEKKGAVVAGSVRQKGAPVAGAIVSVFPQGEALPGQGQAGSHTSFSKEDGSFRIAGLQPGRALLQVQRAVDPYTGMLAAQAREITISATGVTSVTIELPTGEIRGVVLDAGTREPLEGVTVYASAEDARSERVELMAFSKSFSSMGRTQSDGSFTLANIEGGRYTVTAGGGDLFGFARSTHALTQLKNIDVKDGQSVDIGTMRMPLAAVIEGTVEDAAGKPVAGASIFLRTAGTDDDFLQRFSLVTSDPGGYFTYQAVPEGRYDVLCRGPQHATAVKRGVLATAGSRTAITLKLEQGTAVFLVLKEVPASELAQLQVELKGPDGTIPLGLTGIADLAGLMFQFPEPGVYGLGRFAPGKYELKGSLAGKEFAREFELHGQSELRIEVPLR
ncbi:MAG: carboxypeptidase regulatory-like domain-containing protein [Planctomycetota bacterium]